LHLFYKETGTTKNFISSSQFKDLAMEAASNAFF